MSRYWPDDEVSDDDIADDYQTDSIWYQNPEVLIALLEEECDCPIINLTYKDEPM